MRNGWFVRIIGILMILVFFTGCATTMIVNAVDPHGRPVNQAVVLVNGENIGTTPDATTEISNFILSNNEIRVTAPGYLPRTVQPVNEVKVGPLIGGFFCFIPWLWVWGPRPHQNVVLTPE